MPLSLSHCRRSASTRGEGSKPSSDMSAFRIIDILIVILIACWAYIALHQLALLSG